MEEGTSSQVTKTYKDLFKDYKRRRAGFIRALTTEMDELHKQCDPEKEELCLYVFPDGRWKVSQPFDQVPTQLPEPARGINFQRDKMEATSWRDIIALHSDAWLYSVAFYFAGQFAFDKRGRRKLFRKINNLPTVLEVVSKEAPQEKEQNKISGSMSLRHPDTNLEEVKNPTAPKDEYEGQEEGEEQESTPCGTCGNNYIKGEFWILCDTCETWYHGDCVNITPEEADNIEQYKCPRCRSQEG